MKTGSDSGASARRTFFRAGIVLVVVSLACVWGWSLSLDGTGAIAVDMGPVARDYAQGVSTSWVRDGDTFWRRLETRARVSIPVFLEGRGTLTLTLRSIGGPAEIRAELDDVPLGSLSLAPGSGATELRWEIPDGRRRAAVRLRSESTGGSAVEIGKLRFQARDLSASRSVVLGLVSLLALTYLGLALAGLGSAGALAGTLSLGLAMMALSFFDGLAGVHLASRLWPAALAAALVAFLVRFLSPGSRAPLRALFVGAVLFKSALLFHPRFYFVDYPIHETLLELVYHRGMVDFWERLPEYQRIHNLGVAPVAGEYRAFPYPVAFYFLAGASNRVHHAPELWLKLTAALLAACALFPLGSLARSFCRSQRADLFAAVSYLLVPSLTRSLLLLELSAVAGCFFDLLALACLARLALNLAGLRRFGVATGAIAVALVVYTAGFIHFGLFVASALVLGALGRGLSRGERGRLAASGLLAASLALACYHPDSVRALAGAATATGVDAPASAASVLDRATSVLARVVSFLGVPLVGLGIFGFGVAVGNVEPKPVRVLFEAWGLSALVALALRVAFPDLFHFAKELYWGGALLAVGTGGLLASQVASRSRARSVFVAAALAALSIAFAASFREMVGQFYTDYLFL